MKELREKIADSFRRLDKLVIIAGILCSVLSVVMLHSIHVNEVLDIGVDDAVTQAIAAAVGIVCMIVAASVDFHRATKL